jgi:pimeloyl-ACP methyl ester carboxylesterase
MTLHDAARAMGIQFGEEAVPEDKSVTVGGLKLHYLDWGKADKPKMLLLHGGAQTAHSWDFFALTMRDHYHVIAPDQRGHGDSDWSEAGDYATSFHVGDMHSLTDAIGFDQFTLVGLSMGGRNSYGLAAAHPEKVRAMIIVDVGPETQEAGRKRISEFLEDSYEFDSFDWLVARVQQYNPWREEKQIRGSLINNLKRLPDGRWTWKHDRRRGVRRDRGAEFTDNAWEDIAKLRCVTLLVRGAQSDIFSVETAKKMLEIIPDGRLVEVPDAGHLVQGDNPVEFERVAREFLSAKDPAWVG